MNQLAPHVKGRAAAVLLYEAVVALDNAASEITRMRDRIEGLRGLCKWASGRLFDAGDADGADEVLRLVGDMEPPPNVEVQAD